MIYLHAYALVNWVIIGPDNGLLAIQPQAITPINTDFLSCQFAP